MNQAELVLEVLPAGCIIFDDNGRIEYVNPAFCEIVSRTAAELVATDFTKVLTIPSQIFYQTHLFPLLKLEGKAHEIFLTLKAMDGTRVPVVINVKRESSLSSYQNICVITTIWERQKYEQELLSAKNSLQTTINDNQELKQLTVQLQEQKQMLDRKIVELTKRKQEYAQLNKVLTHDMQEPIRKIGVFFDRVLSERGDTSGKELQFLSRIKSLIYRLRKLTDSIQKFVHHEADDEQLNVLRVRELVDDAVREVIVKTGISDFNILFEGDIEFQGRKKDIRSLFTELVSNAVRFRKPGLPLSIRVRSAVVEENSFRGILNEYRYTDHLQIEFRDNGIGFDPKQATYIFGLFNKLDKDSDGVGLGLSLCEQIVSRHHGKITAQSQLGDGAVFVILLPLVQPN